MKVRKYMQEKWTIWNAISNPSEQYHLEACSTTADYGLAIIIRDDSDNKLAITLPGYICSYRITNESFALETLAFLDNSYGKEFYTQNAFFTIENSEYLEWMKTQVDPIAFEYYKFKHYCIFTPQEKIDIISNYEPQISLLENA